MFNAIARHSLYGRIAVGFVLLIALIFALEAATVVWIVRQDREANSAVQQHWRLELTRGVSAKVTATLDASPDQTVDAVFATLPPRPRFFIIFKDGRVLGNAPPPELTGPVVVDLARLTSQDPVPAQWEQSIYAATFLVVRGELVGLLGIVPPTAVQRLGTAFGGVAIGLLAIGILALSLLIVQPVRRRLQELQRAVRQVGSGDLSARAAVGGRNEVSELAAAFNKMADELERRTDAAETSDRLRRQLIADVSHELMTPLTTVLGHLETLTMEELTLDEVRRAKQITIAMREARRLERVIGDLLNAARLEEGGIELDCQAIGTLTLFEQLLARHDNQCRIRNIAMSHAIGSAASTFVADPFRIEQALDNLVMNALRHTTAGGRIQLSATAIDGGIRLEVSDSGEGIASDHLPFIFDRFYKASSSPSIASRGHGLGLAIVKAIVTAHGGHVSAESTPGAGTHVFIDLPTRRAIQKIA